MGVTGLWKLVEPCGKPVPVESLEGKILAVDISIWLHQVVKGYQDSKGSLLPQAHLLGLFHRLCKLLYYRVRPVFVFDGCVPQLKRDTIARRQNQRSKLNSEVERIQALLLQSLAQEQIIQTALGANAQLLTMSPSKKQTTLDNQKDDIFKLPDVPSETETYKQIKIYEENKTLAALESSTSTEDSSFDDSNPWGEYSANLQAIDVRSEQFKSLPPEVRYEILVDIKETRKQSSWGRLHELPSCSDDFSSFQMKRLLKRRSVQETLEETQKEMGEKAITYADLQNLFTDEGILELHNVNQNLGPVRSDEAVRLSLVRDLKKSAKSKAKTNESNISKEYMSMDTSETLITNSGKELGKEYATDLEMAIALSMEDESVNVYSTVDYEHNSNENLKLNPQQRNQLKNAVIGPARAYMIEYGGMNYEEVEQIVDRTHIDKSSDIKKLQEQNSYFTDNVHWEQGQPEDKNESVETYQNLETTEDLSQDICLRVSDDSQTDSDFEEVVDQNQKHENCHFENLEVAISTQNPIGTDDDIFSDIFEYSSEKMVLVESSDHFGKLSKMSNEAVETIQKQQNKSGECDKERQKDKQDIEKIKSPIQVDEKKNTENIRKDNTVSISSILEDLKKQAAIIKNINLDSINIDESTASREIIEIYDSDDQRIDPVITPRKSPKFAVSPKIKDITSYFEPKYIIKRNSEKIQSDPEEEQSYGVKSPYFIKKSPSSSQKSSGGKINKSSRSAKKISKASKTLFIDSNKSIEKVLELKEQDDTHLEPQDLLIKTASDVKQQNAAKDLEILAKNLENERMYLENERNRQDRMGTAISQEMHIECQNLLKLFGIPYIIAPMEAEAQCAFLESVNLTHGTITDDSDIWLFGGRTVYKNFFEQNKHVLKFDADKIKQNFNCDREKFIQLACLVGSDYTTGIHGIGTVTALEIIATFSTILKGEQGANKSHSITTATVISPLRHFRNWFKTHDKFSKSSGNPARLNLRKKLKNIQLYDGFPNTAVVEAYLFPTVDSNEAPFSWGYPNVNSICEFTKRVFGWTRAKTDDLLKPIMKRIAEKQTQTSIRNYFTLKSATKSRELKVSKRVQKAIDVMAGKLDEAEHGTAKNTKAIKGSGKKQKTVSNHKTYQQSKTNQNSDSAANPLDIPSTSTIVSTDGVNKSLPNNKNGIPQREKNLEKMHQNKKKAAALFKKTLNIKKKRTV